MAGTGTRRALVTGAGGFVGSHASELFASHPGMFLPSAGP
jgi:nucleoside-diphosphate-sugar epimerase